MTAGPYATELLAERHVAYILSLEDKTRTSDSLYFTDHKRLSGVYWALSSLALLGRLDALPRARILDYVMSCYRPDAGMFGGNTDQDAHLLYTVSGLQILALYDALHLVDRERVAAAVAALQQADGSFAGDTWGEVDTRFTYCALLALTLLNRVGAVDVDAAVDFVMRCQNFDGGFGCLPGAESHAGQVFCCVGALALADALPAQGSHARDQLAWWLCERQLPCGGFNGRPDKREDVCYSWWVLASLDMLNCKHFIDADALTQFILRCQDNDEPEESDEGAGFGAGGGGIADRPGDMPDVFHTFFGLGGLALLAKCGVRAIDSALALPEDVGTRIRANAEQEKWAAGDVEDGVDLDETLGDQQKRAQNEDSGENGNTGNGDTRQIQ